MLIWPADNLRRSSRRLGALRVGFISPVSTHRRGLDGCKAHSNQGTEPPKRSIPERMLMRESLYRLDWGARSELLAGKGGVTVNRFDGLNRSWKPVCLGSSEAPSKCRGARALRESDRRSTRRQSGCGTAISRCDWCDSHCSTR